MTMHYTPAEDAYLRRKHPEVETDLVLCDDGVYRSPEDKVAHDHSEAIGRAMQLPKMRGLGA